MVPCHASSPPTSSPSAHVHVRPENPLIVQSDHTILVEVASPRYAEARDALLAFAELVKSPEHVHTYRITPLSIWNARSAGRDGDQIVDALEVFSRFPVPDNVRRSVVDLASRYGRVRLVRSGDALLLETDDPALAEELGRHRALRELLQTRIGSTDFGVDPGARGRVKQALVQAGFPAEDLAGYTPGEPLDVALRTQTGSGDPFALRDYQEEAVDAFHAAGSDRGGSGIVVLPCGAGKTVVGLGAMARVRASTLVITTSITAARQWMDELADKTDLQPEMIGEYTGHSKDIRPVTVATYNILTHRRSKDGGFTHLKLFDERDWGLIIYDEVHLLPAPVFQVTAGLQARRRLGLTATLVREDGREDDVFALIGPRRAEVPWKALEREGWIAQACCTEVRLPMPDSYRMRYATADPRARFRVAAENPSKPEVVERILTEHVGEPVLVIGTYVDQIRTLAKTLGAPVLTGSTGQKRRETLLADFRAGRIPVLVVSKVANFAIDLPDASVAIQVSGTFGSRQEEAQRLGRILRPKSGRNQAHFYTLVSSDTVEQEFSLHRQLFLCEQGYEYRIRDAETMHPRATHESP